MKRLLRLAAVLFFVCAIQTAGAATINYTATNIEDDIWRYDYTIYNNSSVDIIAFDIYFDFDDGPYSNLDIFAQPGGGWDASILPPLFWLDEEPWMLSVETDGLPLSYGEGDSLGVFSIVFNWSGVDAPGSQMVRLWDFNDEISYVSTIKLSDIPTDPDIPSVPEPQTFMLLGTSLAGLAAYYRRNQARKTKNR